MKKVALLMRGAISKNKSFECENDLYANGEYINYRACYNSIVKHIIHSNSSDYTFDVFCHCWNVDLQDDIVNLYSPVKFKFEDNTLYNNEISKLCNKPQDFGGISQALTIKKSIELKEEYEYDNDVNYDIVILYRYDVLLWKDLLLNKYTELSQKIYVNAHDNCNGDFHFIMDNIHSTSFKNLYDSINLNNKYRMHYWIQNYVCHYMKKQLIMDDIVPGKHQEVLRKIYNFSINCGFLSVELYNSYIKI